MVAHSRSPPLTKCLAAKMQTEQAPAHQRSRVYLCVCRLTCLPIDDCVCVVFDSHEKNITIASMVDNVSSGNELTWENIKKRARDITGAAEADTLAAIAGFFLILVMSALVTALGTSS